jgi:predicted phage tail protein
VSNFFKRLARNHPQLWSTIKGALIASSGVFVQQILSAISSGGVPSDTGTAIALAVITTILNGIKQATIPKV